MTRKVLVTLGLLVLLVGVLAYPRAKQTFVLANAGTAYVAKTLCSGVLMAGLEADLLLSQELSFAEGVVEVEIDTVDQVVHASALFGLVDARARRHPGLGCSLYYGDELPVALPAVQRPDPTDPAETDAPWPIAPFATPEVPAEIDHQALDRALDMAFAEPDPADPSRTRAIVVVHDGWVAAERYAPGIDTSTPLIGWSMTKSLTHALVGIAVVDGLMALDDPPPVSEWSGSGDSRSAITLDQMLRMSTGLAFEEVYDDFASDAVTMLMRARDAGGLAAAMPLAAEPDTVWAYSSGTSNIIARALRQAIGNDADYWRFPYERLYEPIGMTSAVLETDPSGSFVGSSYSYATARDWARFGLLYLNDGVWDGERILPEGWVDYGVTPTPGAPRREYGAHWWLNAGRRFVGIPADEYRASGFDGQYVMVIPSRRTVIVRLGQTPGDGFDEVAFERAVLAALPGGGSPFTGALLEPSGETSANASMGDLDGDGDVDLVLAKGRHWPLANRVLLNDGRGHFTAHDLGGEPDRTYSGVLADLDLDGDIDVVVSNDAPDGKLVYLNDGQGNFVLSGTWGQADWATRNAAISDLDGDGLPDIIAANRMSASFVCLNDGGARFPRDRCLELPSESATSIVPGDFDGDGTIDLAIPHRDGGQSRIYFNNGLAGFERFEPFGPADASARTAAAGDVDGDGRLDLIVGDERRGTFLYLNSAAGTYGQGVMVGPAGLQPYSTAIADMNRDGAADLVIGYVEAPGAVLLNDGLGRAFETIRFGDDQGAAYGIAIGDLDGDAYPDIAVGRSGAPNVVFFNRLASPRD